MEAFIMRWNDNWPDPSLVSILLGVVAVATVTMWRLSPREAEGSHPGPSLPTVPRRWIDAAKDGCTRGHVGDFLQAHPAPNPKAAHLATCHALAGEISIARGVLLDLGNEKRQTALQVLFGLIHPIADAGHEVAAGPAMELVAELWPQNFQAVYHAGMAAYANEDDQRATRHLERFLEMYRNEDGFRQKAKRALEAIRKLESGESTQRPTLGLH